MEWSEGQDYRVLKQKFHWAGHVTRFTDNRSNRVVDWYPRDWKWLLGKPSQWLKDKDCQAILVIGIMVRVFANGLGDQGSIPGQVIPKTQKMVFDSSLLSTRHYKVQIKGKGSNPGKGMAPSPTPWCSSYWKGSLQVALDNGWPTWRKKVRSKTKWSALLPAMWKTLGNLAHKRISKNTKIDNRHTLFFF